MIQVVSFELAEKLREAGLRWVPKKGDWFYGPTGYLMDVDDEMVKEWEECTLKQKERFLNSTRFAPRLDQLLAEIERRGYRYKLTSNDIQVITNKVTPCSQAVSVVVVVRVADPVPGTSKRYRTRAKH